jgi:signal transduction histidine kinase
MIIKLNLFSIAAFLTFISCLTISIIFLLYGKNKTQNMWALFNLTISFWAFFVGVATESTEPSKSFLLWRIAHSFGIFIPILFFHFVYIFTDLQKKSALIASYCYGFIFTYYHYAFNGVIVYQGVNFLFNSIYYITADKFIFLLSLSPWVIIATLSIHELYCFYTKEKSKRRTEAALILISAIIGFTGGSSTFLPIIGYHNFYPVSIVFVAIHGIINSYAIFKRQILELRVIYQRGLTYSILLTIITLIYVLLIFLSEFLFRIRFGYSSNWISLAIVIIIAIIASPLQSKIQELIYNLMLRGNPLDIANENQLLKQEIERTDQLKNISVLASGIAHEIKNPLTAIQTFSEYLPQKLNDSEFLLKFSKIVGQEVNRIDDLVHQLLEYAKPSPLQLKPINICKLLFDTLDLLSNDFIKHNIQINHDSCDQELIMNLDSIKIRQAVLNLLLNAIDAMPGGGELTVKIALQEYRGEGIKGQEFAKKELSFKTSHHSNPSSFNSQILTITISDTGYGIAKEDLPHIFDPFFSKKDNGTGLGLSITQNIIQEHGGIIRVKSEVGKGTIFTITFPS